MAPGLGPHVAAALAAAETASHSSTGTAAPQLRVRFAASSTTVTQPGTAVAPAAAASAPDLALAIPTTGATTTTTANTRYLALCLDPDAPFPSFPFLGPILHGLQTDLVAAATAPEETDDGQAWMPLTTDTPAVVAYSGPRPPPPSAPHRYVFLVWAQPAGLDAAAVRQKLGLGGSANEPVGLWARMRWDGKAFEEALGLGPVLAASYFLSKS